MVGAVALHGPGPTEAVEGNRPYHRDQAVCTAKPQAIDRSSTSKISVEFGGIAPG